MKKFLLTAIFAFIGFMAFSQERVAVLPIEDIDNVFTRNEVVMFYNSFCTELANRNSGRFIVLPRSDIERLINFEAAFQMSDFSSRAKTAEMQRVLNGTRILSMRIARVDNAILLVVSLYSYPELQQLPGGAPITVANKTELFNKIPELVQLMYSTMAGTRPSDNETPGQTYRIGDTGPAGGIVFYDRGFTGDGWRYLEAAPAGAEFTAQWGAYERDVANTMTAVGFGRQNTQLIIERLRQLGETNRAAQICASLDINGYKDWFLPSRDELNLMYVNLKQKGLGGFGNSWYWSSSLYGKDILAWGQVFGDGGQYYFSKIGTYSVRAVRQF